MPAASTAISKKNETRLKPHAVTAKAAGQNKPALLPQKPNKLSNKKGIQAETLTSTAEQTSPSPKRAAKNAPMPTDLPPTRSTKQEIVLNLLSDPKGVSIEEMMQATSWQKHSVRGFLAGTVKKKLGFTLSSSKAVGDERRYRIEQKKRR